MITIFTIPKPFVGRIAMIQQNAIQSWRRVHPGCEVFLCGDEEGAEEIAGSSGVEYIPDIGRNEFGTPLLNSAFEKIARRSTNKFLCYVNADIILFPDIITAVELVPFRRFLLVGRRRNVDVGESVDFERKDWKQDIREQAGGSESIGPPEQIDMFLFSKADVFLRIPPFAVGRPAWDNWFIGNALKQRLPVIDGTGTVTVIHQNHGYGHVAETRDAKWDGVEGDRNRELAGGWDNLFTILDATHILDPDGVRAARGREYVDRRVERLRKRRPGLFEAMVSWKLRYLLCYLFPAL